jgi:transcription elongation factor Elf1
MTRENGGSSSYDVGSNDAESKEIADTFIDRNSREIEITTHAIKQWIARTSEKFTDYELKDAWEDAVSVGYSGATAKLFCPEDLVILMRGRRIRTAKKIHHANLTTDHLAECSDCGYLNESRICPWCNHRLVATSNTDPELIGSTSAIVNDECSECGADATHSTLWYTEDGLMITANCHGHGHFTDADYSRKWAEEVQPESLLSPSEGRPNN